MTQDELVEQARELLADLGMDKERSNERSAMTFLALARMGTDSGWADATNGLYTTRMLMEAYSTNGSIDVVRKRELLELFASHKSKIVFVSCFPDRTIMRQYLSDLAWETEAWCASDPDHIIHLDGERFMGPYEYGVAQY